ncbi:MAG TPA: hypothetical protein VGL71_10400 [Urbifossiella sp.]
MNPLPAARVLDHFFLEARARLLDVAAILDRVGRGDDLAAAAADPRMGRIHKAIAALQSEETGRAERIQQIFSLEYDPSWPKPRPR